MIKDNNIDQTGYLKNTHKKKDRSVEKKLSFCYINCFSWRRKYFFKKKLKKL